MSAVNGEIVIHLNAIANNWCILKSRFTGRNVGAVVKANAYGLGEREVVSTLLDVGCQLFFVSNLSEAISVRGVAPDAAVVVFSGCSEGEEADFERYRIQPVLVSHEMLVRWAAYSFNLMPNAYIKVDTGMGRYGLSLDDFHRALSDYDFEALGVYTLMSHLASSELPSAAINQQQLALFDQAYTSFCRRVPSGMASLCNSSAIFNFDAAHFDVARPGFALYGGNPLPNQINPMQSVVVVTLPIVQVRDLKKGDSVGYGGDFNAQHAMQVATVYGGYADGVLRSGVSSLSLGWGQEMLPIVGRVSMDSLVVDITHVAPDERPQVGDRLIFIGGMNTLDKVAGACGTIGYELLTSLSRRFKRVYVGGHVDSSGGV